MTTTSATAAAMSVSLELIDVGANVSELNLEHVEAPAESIALRGLLVPLVAIT